MEKGLSKEKLQEAVDLLEQCMLAFKFYVGTKDPQYIKKVKSASKKLHLLLTQKGESV